MRGVCHTGVRNQLVSTLEGHKDVRILYDVRMLLLKRVRTRAEKIIDAYYERESKTAEDAADEKRLLAHVYSWIEVEGETELFDRKTIEAEAKVLEELLVSHRKSGGN